MKSLLRLLAALIVFTPILARAEDGYDLWLRYRPVEAQAQASYRAVAAALLPRGDSATIKAATDELRRGLASGLLRDQDRSGRVANVAADGAGACVRHAGELAVDQGPDSRNLPLSKLGQAKDI